LCARGFTNSLASQRGLGSESPTRNVKSQQAARLSRSQPIDNTNSRTMSAPAEVSRKTLQDQNFLREMDLTPVTMVNCLRSTHSDVMHLATTVLVFQQEGPAKGFGAKLNGGATARVLNPKTRKQRVKPIATRKKHVALLREHADFMARLTAERTERLEIESWAASRIQVAVRRFLRRTDRRFGGAVGATLPHLDPQRDRFLADMATPDVDLAGEIRALVDRSNKLVDAEDDDLDKMPPWQRQEAARARNKARAKKIRQRKLRAATMLQAATRGFIGRRAIRYMNALEREERQTEAAVFIQSHARVFTTKTAEFKLQQLKIEKSIIIQALFRGYVDRAVVRVIHHRLDLHSRRVESAVRIQSLVRRWLAKQKVHAMNAHSAAVRIQANVRATSARKRIERTKQTNAATAIQSKIRSRQASRLTQHIREEKAALKLQASGRAMLARKEVNHMREENAAVKIQAVARGRAQREAETRKVKEEAAVIIQAAHRGRSARQLAEAQEKSAVAIQKVVRGSIDRREQAAQAAAASKIQAVHRGNATRKSDVLEQQKAQKEQEAATDSTKPKDDTSQAADSTADATETSEKDEQQVEQARDDGVPVVTETGEEDQEAAAASKLQALARGRAARAELEAQEKAAIELQKVVRGRQDRAAVEVKRQERKAALEAEAAAQDTESRSVKRREIP